MLNKMKERSTALCQSRSLFTSPQSNVTILARRFKTTRAMYYAFVNIAGIKQRLNQLQMQASSLETHHACTIASRSGKQWLSGANLL